VGVETRQTTTSVPVRDTTQPHMRVAVQEGNEGSYRSVGLLVYQMGNRMQIGTAFVVSHNKIFTSARHLYDPIGKQKASEAYFVQPQLCGSPTWELNLAYEGVILPGEWLSRAWEEDHDNYDMAVAIINDKSFAAGARPPQFCTEGMSGKNIGVEALGFQKDKSLYTVTNNMYAAKNEGSVMASGGMGHGAAGGPWIYDGKVVGSTVVASPDGDIWATNNGKVANMLINA